MFSVNVLNKGHVITAFIDLHEVPCQAGYYNHKIGSTSFSACKKYPSDEVSKSQGSGACLTCPCSTNPNDEQTACVYD